MTGSRAWFVSLVSLSALVLVACGGGRFEAKETGAPRARCAAGDGTVTVLLADWSAARMAAMQTNAERSVVVVAYDGCSLSLLDGCHLPGEYVFNETAHGRELSRIETAVQLEEQLPLGAEALRGELARGGALELDYVVRGTLVARISDKSKGMLIGDCESATHFVHSLVTGAYRLGAGLGGKEALRRGGDVARCDAQEEPRSAVCGALVQAVLMPIAEMTSDREDLYSSIKGTADMEEALRALAALAGTSQPPPPGGGEQPAGQEAVSEMSRRISALPDGGSDAWDEGIKPMMVGEYDRDGSGIIDTVDEVAAIPCEVLHTLDRSIRSGRGGVSALRTTYGFPERYHWVGYALGFDETVRAQADARLANCGL